MIALCTGECTMDYKKNKIGTELGKTSAINRIKKYFILLCFFVVIVVVSKYITYGLFEYFNLMPIRLNICSGLDCNINIKNIIRIGMVAFWAVVACMTLLFCGLIFGLSYYMQNRKQNTTTEKTKTFCKNSIKKILNYCFILIGSVVIFYLVKYAIIGVLSSLDGNNNCILSMRHRFVDDTSALCKAKVWGITLFATMCGLANFIVLAVKKINTDRAAKKKNRKKEQKTTLQKILSHVWALLFAVLIFYLIKYAIKGTTFEPLRGYMCPMDWGPGSANWACRDSLAKLAPHAWFVTATVPAVIGGMIAFLIAFPKTTNYDKWIRWFVLVAILAICGYYIITEPSLMLNALISNINLA